MEDRKSWMIKDGAILDDLLALISLTDEEKELLSNLQEPAQAIAPTLSEAFYHRLLAHPNTAEYISGQIDERKKTLERWFIELFQGNYDQAYLCAAATENWRDTCPYWSPNPLSLSYVRCNY